MIQWLKNLLQRCTEAGCWKRGLRCSISGWGVEPDTEEWVCSDHLEQAGFCALCRCFSAGTEAFDFGLDGGRYRGFCEGCAEDCIAEEEIDDAAEEWGDYWDVPEPVSD